jgi:hypothetical protein
MEHSTKETHKHVAEDEGMTPYQRFMHRAVMRLLELSSLELIVTTLHLVLFAAVVFGIVGTSEGH